MTRIDTGSSAEERTRESSEQPVLTWGAARRQRKAQARELRRLIRRFARGE